MTSIATPLYFFVAGLSFVGSLLLQETKPTETERSLATVYRAAQRYYEVGDYPSALREANELCLRSDSDVRVHYLKGEIAFADGKMVDSIEAYDRVAELDPRSAPQLWQRGLALYYAERFEDGVKQFETHQTVNSHDVENAVWHLLCAARLTDVDHARKELIPIVGDVRVPMSQVYEMFAGRLSPDDVLVTASIATPLVPAGSERHRLQLYYAHLYIGLFWEMLGEPEKSLDEMKAAREINPLGKSNFMGRVAAVHLSKREPGSHGESEESGAVGEKAKN